MLTTILIVFVALLLSAFFSGSEIAYLSANRLNIEVYKNKGSKKSDIITDLYDDPKRFLSTMLVGNNIVLVVYTIFFSSIISPLFESIVPEYGWLVSLLTTLVLTLILLIFGEYIPKTIFRIYANDLIYRLASFLSFFKWILSVPAYILTGLSNKIIKLIFGQAEIEESYSITPLDLEHFIQQHSHDEESLDKEILTNALNLNQVKVEDCMIPRNEIVFVDKNDNLDTVKKEFEETKHSRLIVVDGDIENVVGYIHHQLLFKNITSIKRHIRDVAFFPEVMNIQELLHHFIKSRTNIAIVVDEYGSVAGLITLEDILEEIFGEIEDEYDEEDYTEKVLSPNEYIFSGRLELDYLNDKYPNLRLPDEEYNTLSGYIVMTHGSIPEDGEEIILDRHKFVILSKSETKIEEVKVIVLNNQKSDTQESHR